MGPLRPGCDGGRGSRMARAPSSGQDGFLGSSIRRRRWGRRGARGGGGSAKGPAPEPQQRAPKAKQGRGGRRGRGRALVAALVTAGVGLGGGYLYAVIILFPVSNTPVLLQQVPDLRGQPLALALAVLSDSGLAANPVDSVRHPQITLGQVIGQSPLPGFTALPGHPVRLTVSAGREVRPVPDLTRLDGARAAELLVAGGFLVTADTIESTAPAGRILEIDPAPGSELELPAQVRLAISQGPPTLPMPDLSGLSLGEAFALLRSHGLLLGEVERRYSLLNVGRVFGQSPAMGEEVVAGTRVRLAIGQPIRMRDDLPIPAGRPPGARR